MVAKGRVARQRGERSGRSKLSDAQVAAIRSGVAAGATQQAMAEQFGVHPAHVSRIVNRMRRP